DKVYAQLQSKTQVRDILLTQRWDGNIHAWQRYALVVRDWSAFGHAADNIVAIDFDALNGYLAVIDKQAIARLGILREVLIGRGDTIVGTFDILDGNAHDFIDNSLLRAIIIAAEADLRALQVRQDAHCAAGSVGSITYPVVVLYMIGVVAVGEVQTGNIHGVLNKT